jgi:hypothetical protein
MVEWQALTQSFNKKHSFLRSPKNKIVFAGLSKKGGMRSLSSLSHL